ncbi:hypothetical protein [Ulvibacterium sp.]|uniref:hypothetical protein n=1 Tax=Ulvibacterium sp. TaxID=2665914 RepID=UPI003BA99CCD
MELEELKSEYQNIDKGKNREAMRKMGSANRHPVLKRIRLQLVLESLVWAILLSVYYTGFDGHQKPWYLNAALIVSVLLLLLHNVLGYRLVQSPISGSSVSESLRCYAQRVKKYARISIAARVIAITALLSFFAFSVDWNMTKIVASTLFVAVLFFVQVFFLRKVWKGRIGKIEGQIDSLET